MVARTLERRSDPAKNHQRLEESQESLVEITRGLFAFFLVDILRSWLRCAFLKVSRSSDTIHIYD